VLPARHRMRRRADFAAAVRRGRRGTARRVVVHYAGGDPASPALVGFVVARAVGGAVGRNRVKRRLRGLMAHEVTALPDGSLVVVRALPDAAEATSAELSGDLSEALSAARSPRTSRRKPR
jgi:ribonuclease P protein component